MKSKLLMVGAITPRSPSVCTRVKILSIETLTKSNFDNGLPFLDVIATDERGDQIALTLKNTHKKKYEDLLKEHNVYALKNVGTLKLNNQGTNLNHLPSTQWSGSNGFKFIPFLDLITCQLPEKHTADVVSRVNFYDREPKSYGTGSDDKSKYINLEHKDLDGSIVSCTVFAKYMVNFLAYMKTVEENQCVILTIQFGRTRKYQRQLTVGIDWSHTRVFMDNDIPVIDDFRNRYMEGVFVVEAEIIAVEPDETWSYIACKKCHTKEPPTSKDVDFTLDIDQQLLLKRRCKDRGQNPQVALRFKVSVRVADDTGVATFTLFESLVEINGNNKKYTQSKYTVKEASTDDLDRKKIKQMKLEAEMSDLSFSTKCGSSSMLSKDKHTVDLTSSTRYTPPKFPLDKSSWPAVQRTGS
ncbi:uncharacterized protein [Rutidosis leptorrhynchoides]|uniref:uncharacterized protein n=1 Tax=Rutidosis leptorrhynchoides TaxID=125765 RepID=UPI003A9936C9